MRTLVSAAIGALVSLSVSLGTARADTIKSFDALISLGGVNQYAFVIDGTITLDTTTETFTGIDLGFSFITSFFPFTAIESQSSSPTDISFTAVSPGPSQATIVIAIAKSTFGSNPADYAGGPIDPAGTFFYFGPTAPTGPYTPPASERGTLTFIAGSTVITPVSSVPEPTTIGLLAGLLSLAGVLRFRRG